MIGAGIVQFLCHLRDRYIYRIDRKEQTCITCYSVRVILHADPACSDGLNGKIAISVIFLIAALHLSHFRMTALPGPCPIRACIFACGYSPKCKTVDLVITYGESISRSNADAGIAFTYKICHRRDRFLAVIRRLNIYINSQIATCSYIILYISIYVHRQQTVPIHVDVNIAIDNLKCV